MDGDRDGELKLENERLRALNGVLLDTAKNQESLLKQLRKMILTISVCFTLIICCMICGFFWYESQFEEVEAVTTTTTTSTEMETSGENANINNVTDGNMYNDNAVHNETKE